MAKLTLADAKIIAAAVQEEALRINKAVSTVIVDAGGYSILSERMDLSRPLTPSISLAKAYTAAVMQRPGIMLKGWCKSQPEFFAQVSRMGHQPIVAAEGSVTIKKDGELIGGLGVAGGTGDEDQEICEKVLAALGYELDFKDFASAKPA